MSRLQGDGARVLITGASSGLGAATAQRLASEGYAVWLAARRAEKLSEQVEQIRTAGGHAEAVVLDVSDGDRTAARVVELDSEVGGFDVVIANAGIDLVVRPHKLEWAAARDTLQTNLLGAFATLLPFIGPMAARGRGHLVGISSLSADLPLPLGSIYGASKAALTYALDAIRPGLRRNGVAVTAMNFGFIKTPMTENATVPMPFMLELEDAADAVLAALRDKPGVVRVPRRLAAFAHLFRSLPRPLRDEAIRRLRL